jgi:hypothetical protein
LRHLPEYIPLVDKVDKTQLYKGPIEIESVVFKEEIVDGKFIQNMIVTRNIRNLQVEPTLIEPTLIEPTLIEPTLVKPTLIQQVVDLIINIDYLWVLKILIIGYIIYKILKFIFSKINEQLKLR